MLSSNGLNIFLKNQYFKNDRYYFDFYDALAQCQQIGANLVSIHSKEENEIIGGNF